jgi:hypothetical protein
LCSQIRNSCFSVFWFRTPWLILLWWA